MSEVRPTLLDDVHLAAGRRSGDPGSTGQDGRFLNWLGRHAMKARPEIDDEDDEVSDDEDFDDDSELDEDEDDLDNEDEEEEETWQVSRNLTSVG